MTARLMAMMFLQFFIWGAWYATGGNYMKSRGMTDLIYVAYMASPIGSIVAPFFLGMIADRLFPVQKVLGVMHILSGLFVFAAPFLAEPPLASPPLFLTFLLPAHAVLHADGRPGDGHGVPPPAGQRAGVSARPRVRHHWMDRGRDCGQLSPAG